MKRAWLCLKMLMINIDDYKDMNFLHNKYMQIL